MAGPVERVTEQLAGPWLEEHLARYVYVSSLVRDAPVLDIACGSGLGLPILVRGGARQVVGIDISHEALQDALEHDSRSVSLCRADGGRLPLRPSCFEVVTSFETIEHTHRPAEFLDELARVLSPRGRLFLSTPNALFTKPVAGVPKNPFHVREFLPDELRALLQERFAIEEILAQRVSPAYGPCPYWDLPEWTTRVDQNIKGAAWKLLNRLPAGARDPISRVTFRRSFYPTKDDFDFTSDLTRGHVLFASCVRR